MRHGFAYVYIEHRLLIRDEQHADVRNRMRHAGHAKFLGQAVELFEGNFQGQVALAALHFRYATCGVRDKLENDGIERRFPTPVFRKGFQPHVGIALEFVHHVGAGADGFAVPIGTRRGEGFFRHQIAGQERHPGKQRRFEFLHVAGDFHAIDFEVADLAPHKLNRIAAFRVASAFQRPNDIFRRHRRTIMPKSILTQHQFDLGFVRIPSPFSQNPGFE